MRSLQNPLFAYVLPVGLGVNNMPGRGFWGWLGSPRGQQITILSILLLYGIGWLDFEISTSRIFWTFGLAVSAQYAWMAWMGTQTRTVDSALISALSLLLLLRPSNWLWMALAPVIAISSKFLVRAKGRHLFNPANFAIVVAIGLEGGWVDIGQWGNSTILVLFAAAFGWGLCQRVKTLDICITFLVMFASIALVRGLWLADSVQVTFHGLLNGSLIVFAFFMITDPRTTPDHRWARVMHGMLIAGLAAWLHYVHFRPDASILALAMTAWMVPIWNRYLNARRFEWRDVNKVDFSLTQTA